jgi:hypothetical protein
MSRIVGPVALAAAALLAQPGLAHGVAGPRLFVNTLLIDDPAVADEATLGQFQWMRVPGDAPGDPAVGSYNYSFEFDKRITETFGFGISDEYNWLRSAGSKTQSGWGNLEVSAKYQPYVNAEHEFMLSVGVIRTFGRTGNSEIDDNTSSTTPTIYWGKGLGDLPISWLRPLAITGTFGYQVADQKFNPNTGGGATSLWTGGLSVQYSLQYLQTQVKDVGLNDFFTKLTPLVEIAWQSPGNKPNDGSVTQYLIGAGAIYTSTNYAVGLEMLIPGNKATGTNVGVVAHLHLYFDDLFPNSLGKPIVDWGRQ